MNSRKIRNICIVLLVLIFFVYTVIFVNSHMNGDKVGFLSIRFYSMSSDSEEANIHTGDLVLAKSIQTKDIKENDTIILKRNNEMLVKKVVSINSVNGNNNLVVQNDDTISGENLENSEIIGKVVTNIKGLGNLAVFVQSPLGTINMLLIFLCIIIVVKKLTKDSQKDANDEKEECVEK